MSDLVERLRAGENFYAESSLWFDRKLAEAVDEAADRITALEAEVERLRTWRDAAFLAHPNIDADIEAALDRSRDA